MNDERKEKIEIFAAIAMHALLSNPERLLTNEEIARFSVRQAKSLVEAIEREL